MITPYSYGDAESCTQDDMSSFQRPMTTHPIVVVIPEKNTNVLFAFTVISV